MKDKWFLVLRLGVSCGLLVGSTLGAMFVIANQYLGYGMYYTILLIGCRYIDYSVLILTSAFSLVWMLFHIDSVLSRGFKIAYRSLVLLELAALGVRWVGFGTVMDNLHTVFTQNGEIRVMLMDYSLQILTSIAFLVLGILAIRLVRRGKLQSKVTNDVTAVTASRTQRTYPSRCFVPFLAIFALINIASGLSWSWAQFRLRDKPNVVLIIVDTLRADDLSCYGCRYHTTPNIDLFARDGMKFSRAISQAPWTTWSIGSLLTSQYPEVLFPGGSSEEDFQMGQNVITWAEVMREKGYSTAAIISNTNISKAIGFGQGYDFFDESNAFSDVSSPGVTSITLDQIAKTHGKFFLTVHYMDPHAPYIMHGGYDFYPDYHGPRGRRIEIFDRKGFQGYDADDLKYARALYDSDIAYTDHYVGKVIDKLKRAGAYDRSLIIFVADHGEEFMEHGNAYHGQNLYDEESHVPCIVKLPFKRQGRTVVGTFPLIDLLPSVAGYLGFDVARYHTTGSAVNLDNMTKSPSEYVFSATNKAADIRSVEYRGYKLIKEFSNRIDLLSPGKKAMLFGDRSEVLFDLSRDPEEKHDVSIRQPSEYADLKKMLTSHKKDGEAMAHDIGSHTPAELDEIQQKKLRSLGYLQ